MHITDSGTTKDATSDLETGHECHDQRKPSIASSSEKSIGHPGGVIRRISSGLDCPMYLIQIGIVCFFEFGDLQRFNLRVLKIEMEAGDD